MSAKIHPYLLARLIAVQEAFNHPGFRPALIGDPSLAPSAPIKAKNNWKDILKDEDAEDGKDGGGGGGTMKGNRGKNAVNAAASMRKLSRNR